MRRTLTPVSPSPMATATASCHGGNQYRGPGAWKRPRVSGKSSRLGTTGIITNSPLDLTAILDAEGLRCDSRKESYRRARKNRSKQSNTAALKARLESLSLLLAPSHGIDGASAPSIVLDEPRHAHHDKRPPVCLVPCCPQQASSGAPTSSVAPPRQHENLQLQIQDHQAQYYRENPECASVAVASETRRHHTPLDTSNLSNPTLTKTETGQKCELLNEWNDINALRDPNAATKMAVDDRCNAELLDARTALRMLLKEQTKLREAICRRRLEARLGTNGIKLRKNVSVNGKSNTRNGRRGHRRHGQHSARVGAGDARRRAHAHPLLFMDEDELQKVELDQMNLADAEAVHLSKFEEAQRRKQDYSTYYAFSLRYGCLPADQFELAPYPGKSYHDKVWDAVRIVQNWWWSVWPPLLRRRRAAVLLVQAAVRGFLQKKKWRAIIRLRALWGNTRIVAHAFVCWKGSVVWLRRVKLFSRRFRHRCQLGCLAALSIHAQQKRQAREDILRRRLRRAAQGLRLQLFEAWVRYTEVSLAVKRMYRRSSMLPVFRAWHDRASCDRRHQHMGRACAVLVSRMLRWRRRAQYVDLRKACIKIQRITKVRNARARVVRASRDHRIRRAKEMVQAVKDERIRGLIDAEQQRRDSLQTILDQETPSANKTATAFLRTASGKMTLSSTLATMREAANAKALQRNSPGALRSSDDGPSTPTTDASALITEAETRREIVRRLVRQEQFSVRHDFNAESPPPLRCPRADCDATFVDPYHCVRHEADIHSASEGSTRTAELAVALGDPVGLAAFDRYIGGSRSGGVTEVVAAPRYGLRQGMEPSMPTGSADVTTGRCALDLWKTVEEWRKAQTSSERYRELALSIYDQITPSSSTGGSSINRSHLPDAVARALVGELDTGERTTVTKQNTFGISRWVGRAHGSVVDRQPSEDTPITNPQALEEASWQALVSLFETNGETFLESAPYASYLDEVDRPTRDAVAVAAKDIADRERAEWSAEARALKQEALRQGRETAANAMAETALERFLDGTATGGIVGKLVDDQAALLAAVIIAERGAFAKVISAVWNEAVDEAAHQATRERREISPAVAGALSEAACSVARTRVMDALIDQSVADMTSPDGEFWPDARAMMAVADGVAYRVRCDVMEEMLEGSVLELLGSGEAETLLAGAAPLGVEVDERRSSDGEVDGEVGTERLVGRTRGKAERVREPNSGVDRGMGVRREEGTATSTASGSVGADVEQNHLRSVTSAGSNDKRGTAAEVRTNGEGSSAASSCEEGWPCGEYDKSPCSAPVPMQRDTSPDSYTSVDISSTRAGEEVGSCMEGSSAADGGGSDGNHDSSGITTIDAKMTTTSPVELRAVLMVQSMVRRKAVYRQTKALVARNYVKLYDADSGYFYWYNQVTGASTWEKPVIIDSYFKKK